MEDVRNRPQRGCRYGAPLRHCDNVVELGAETAACDLLIRGKMPTALPAHGRRLQSQAYQEQFQSQPHEPSNLRFPWKTTSNAHDETLLLDERHRLEVADSRNAQSRRITIERSSNMHPIASSKSTEVSKRTTCLDPPRLTRPPDKRRVQASTQARFSGNSRYDSHDKGPRRRRTG